MSRHPEGSSYPIARCPHCGCTVLYANDPKEKRNVTVVQVSPDYKGPMHKCSRCNTMFAVIEKIHMADHYVAVPILGSVS